MKGPNKPLGYLVGLDLTVVIQSTMSPTQEQSTFGVFFLCGVKTVRRLILSCCSFKSRSTAVTFHCTAR